MASPITITHKYSELIKLNLVSISEQLGNVRSVILRMYSGGLLSITDKEQIECTGTLRGETAMCERLLTTFMRKCPTKDEYGLFCTILAETKNLHILKILDAQLQESQHTKSSLTKSVCLSHGIWFETRRPVDSFTGRTNELSMLKAYLYQKVDKAGRNTNLNYVLIAGLGGVGKSDFVRKYVEENYEDYEGNVVWINANNRLSMTGSFRRLGLRLEMANLDKLEVQDIVDRVYAYFNNKKVLFVFDNAESYKNSDAERTDGIYEFLPNHLPTFATAPDIVITTRNRDLIDSNCVHLLLLDVLTAKESIAFITRVLEAPEQECTELGTALQHLPLALQQATAYIAQENRTTKLMRKSFGIEDYLKLFTEESQKLLDFGFPPNSTNVYDKTTYITWKITFEKIGQNESYGSLAIYSMTALAYLAPENISLEMIVDICQPVSEMCQPSATSCTSQMLCLGALNLSKQYSMFDISLGEVHIHRLVQHVLRLYLHNDGGESNVLDQLLAYFNEKYTKSSGGIPETNHAVSVWLYTANLPKLVTKYHKLTSRISTDIIFVRHNVSTGQEFEFKSLKMLENAFGERSERVLEYKYSISHTLHMAGKLEESLGVRRDILRCYESMCESGKVNSSAEVINARLSVAQILLTMGRHDEAAKMLMEIKQDTPEDLIKDGTHLLEDIKTELAQYYMNTRKYEQANELLNEILEATKARMRQLDKGSSGDKPTREIELHNFLRMQMSLAGILRKQRKYDEATELYSSIGETYAQFFALNHPTVSESKRCIGYVLTDQGKYPEAMAIFQEVMEHERTVRGKPETPDAPLESEKLSPTEQITWNNIANCCLLIGDYKRGLRIVKHVLKDQVKIFGEESPSIAITSDTIARLLHAIGRIDEALKIHSDNVRIREKAFGLNDYCTASSQYGVALALSALGRLDEARNLFERVFVIQKEQLGLENLQTMETRAQLANLLVLEQRYEEGLKEFYSCYKEQVLIFGSAHPHVLNLRQCIADALRLIGKEQESLEIYKEICDVSEKVLGSQHPIVLVRQHNLRAALAIASQEPSDAEFNEFQFQSLRIQHRSSYSHAHHMN